MAQFTRDLEDLLYLSTQKIRIVTHLRKNYRENIHYIVEKKCLGLEKPKQNGGQNKMIFKLTEEAFDLLKNSFNLRNRYIVDISDKVKCVNIGMCIENQTIGFIENAYKKSMNLKRQHIFGKYRVDLYFIDYNLIIECDENNHEDRDPIKEKTREYYLISLGNKIIRYNPNEKGFDLSNVLSEINAILYPNKVLNEN
jgi:very-short-patch-repair endonuclease